MDFKQETEKHKPTELKTMEETDVKLTESQAKADEIINRGDNIFLTGEAGTGKSWLVERAVRGLGAEGKRVNLLAPTGIAACNIGGQTIHSRFRLPPDIERAVDYLPHINRRAVRSPNVIVLDEVSMIPAHMLDGLEMAFREFREDSRPWGGCQVIAVGDFFQLPPIGKGYKFAFQAECWGEFNPVSLREVVRQDEADFKRALESVRMGRLGKDKASQKLLGQCVENRNDDQIFLAGKRKKVDDLNETAFEELPGEPKLYVARNSGEEKFLKACLIPNELQVKMGMRVMNLLNNAARGLVNGNLGTVVDWSEDDFPVVQWDNIGTLVMRPEYKDVTSGNETVPVKWSVDIGAYIDDRGNEYPGCSDDETVVRPKVVASRKQVPICQANALTIHKSQGLTFNNVYVDCSNFFVKGHPYVALSRATSLEGLGISKIPKDFVDGMVVRYQRILNGEALPV